MGARPDAALFAMNIAMRPIHPGEILREKFLLPLRLSANALSMPLCIPAPRIDDIARKVMPAEREAA